jgi:hypothetical protein
MVSKFDFKCNLYRYVTWLNDVEKEIGTDVSNEKMTEFVWATLKSGRVVPGYGGGAYTSNPVYP